jgi:hypothetical protein
MFLNVTITIPAALIAMLVYIVQAPAPFAAFGPEHDFDTGVEKAQKRGNQQTENESIHHPHVMSGAHGQGDEITETYIRPAKKENGKCSIHTEGQKGMDE